MSIHMASTKHPAMDFSMLADGRLVAVIRRARKEDTTQGLDIVKGAGPSTGNMQVKAHDSECKRPLTGGGGLAWCKHSNAARTSKAGCSEKGPPSMFGCKGWTVPRIKLLRARHRSVVVRHVWNIATYRW